MTDEVPFLDLTPMHDEVREALDQAWTTITRSNQYIGGPVVERFEADWASFCGCEHAVGVANGTDAIEVALRAAGIGPGDEVIVPANTFIATVEAVLAAGAEPKLVDVDSSTLLITAEQIAGAITDRTAAVIVVHLFGHVVPMEEISRLADDRGLLVVEDAAQAHGARWRGSRAGSLGHVATFSFYPGKNLGALGDGGAVVTNDREIATRARQIANHGSADGRRYEHIVLGRNSRLDAIQAAVLTAKLTRLDRWNAMRRTAASHYRALFEGVAGVELTLEPPSTESVHHLFPVRVAERDRVQAEANQHGLGVGVHYPFACHEHAPYSQYSAQPLPVVEDAARRLLSLPIYPHITEAQIERVAAVIRKAVERERSTAVARS